MKNHKISLSVLFYVIFLIGCNKNEISIKAIDRHEVNSLLREFFQGKKPVYQYKSEDFLIAFNKKFETRYTMETIHNLKETYFNHKKKNGTISTSTANDDLEDFNITELEGIEGYDYFKSLYNYETTSISLDALEIKALSDLSLSEEVASSILGLIYIKRLMLSQIEQTGVLSNQCPDTPENGHCIKSCESEWSSRDQQSFNAMLRGVGVSFGAPIAVSFIPGFGQVAYGVTVGIGVAYSVGEGINSLVISFNEYEQCVWDCNRDYPCR